MITAALIFAGLAALLHVYIFVMESLTWTSARTRATFGTTPEEAETTKLLAFNQGFYNLFLAIVTAVGIVAMCHGAHRGRCRPGLRGRRLDARCGGRCCSRHRRTRRAPPSRRARSPLIAVVLLALGLAT